jgi:uncharacterized membrane protein YcgQ (UPF0703/DUF1980 family)
MNKSKSAGRSFVVTGLILAVTMSLFTTSCAKKGSGVEAADENVLEIKEKMFITQVNDVYLNAEDYLGRTIKLEGLFKEERYYDDKTYCFVLRYGPGCCGYDGNAGFEVAWDKEKAKPYPEVDSWVEATGVLKSYKEEDDMEYLYLDLASLNVLSKRGAEMVYQ